MSTKKAFDKYLTIWYNLWQVLSYLMVAFNRPGIDIYRDGLPSKKQSLNGIRTETSDDHNSPMEVITKY